jgi:hypothetical protein
MSRNSKHEHNIKYLHPNFLCLVHRVIVPWMSQVDYSTCLFYFHWKIPIASSKTYMLLLFIQKIRLLALGPNQVSQQLLNTQPNNCLDQWVLAVCRSSQVNHAARIANKKTCLWSKSSQQMESICCDVWTDLSQVSKDGLLNDRSNKVKSSRIFTE